MKWLKLIGVSLLVLTVFCFYEVGSYVSDEWSVSEEWTVSDEWTVLSPPPVEPPGDPDPPPTPDTPAIYSPGEFMNLIAGINFIPNPTGLNTEYNLLTSMAVSNFSLVNEALYISKVNGLYWINTTSGSNNSIGLIYWFNTFGSTTETRFTANNTFNVNVYVGALGEPDQVYGVVSHSFDNVTNISSLVVGTGGDIRLLWQFDPIGEYFFLGLGLGGFVFVGVGCFYSTRRLRNINTDDDILQVSWGLLVALVGVGLIIVWLWP